MVGILALAKFPKINLPKANLSSDNNGSLKTRFREDLLPNLEMLKPANKKQLRKVLDDVLLPALGGSVETTRGGAQLYKGSVASNPVAFHINLECGGTTQLEYKLRREFGNDIPDALRCLLNYPMPYEGLWHAAGAWDFLTEENAERSLQVLPELLGRLVELVCSVDRLSS